MKKKKVLALVLAVATLLGGCGKAPAETAGNTAAEKESGAASTTAAESTGSEAAAGEEGGEPMELECMVDLSTDDKVYENSLLIKEIEKELNVKIKLIPEPTGTADDIRKAMNLQIASGDFPDFIPKVKFPDYYAYAQQGCWLKSRWI